MTSESVSPKTVSHFLGWRMVGLGFLCQNLVLGATYGTYSLLIKPLSDSFAAPRSLTSLGIALITLMMGLVAPWLGRALDRHSIRAIMMGGSALVGLGLLIAAQAQSIAVFLIAYTLLVGAGAAMMGPIAAATLANNWFEKKRGLAMGIVSIPLLTALMPLAFSQGMEVMGWRHSLTSVAALFFLVLPVMMLIVGRPKDVGQSPYGAQSHHPDTSVPVDVTPRWTSAALLTNTHFWTLILFAGLITAGSIVIITHIVPFATDYGITDTQASILLACNGVCSMIGALAVGWIADRFGADKALALTAALQAGLWCVLLYQPTFPVLLLAILGIGFSGGGAVPAFNSLLAHSFGALSFGTALGLASVILLPLNFGAPVVAGILFDSTGDYSLAFEIHIAMFSAAAVFFFFLCRRVQSQCLSLKQQEVAL